MKMLDVAVNIITLVINNKTQDSIKYQKTHLCSKVFCAGNSRSWPNPLSESDSDS